MYKESNKMSTKWVIQTSLGQSEGLENACKELGINNDEIVAIPFSREIPKIECGDVIFYGAVNFMQTIWEFNQKNKRWNPGVWFNEENFNFKTWRAKYTNECLNWDAEITTLGELEKKDYTEDTLLFIRPCSDLKTFSGQVIRWGAYKKWLKEIDYGIPELKQAEILVGETFGIASEWRLFIVDGKVSSGSRYRTYHRLDKSPYVPERVIKYAEKISATWTPAPVFSLDIAESGEEELYVNEIGCFHSSGFYCSDIKKIVQDVTNYVENLQ